MPLFAQRQSLLLQSCSGFEPLQHASGCNSELLFQRQLWLAAWAGQMLAVDWVRVTHMMYKAQTQINT